MQITPQPLTYYQQQFLQIKELFFSKDYLYTRIIQAKFFIDRYYCNRIDIDAMANEACFSKYHFIRLFKKAYGKAPHQYLIAVRIENAKLLLQSHHAVSETCFAVGFDSPGSFSSLFKKMTGLTPSAYQDNYQKPSRAVAVPLKWLPYCYPQNRNFKEAALPATADL